jgi:phage terminase small subunit
MDDSQDLVAKHEYGPAMARLGAMQQKFVEAYMEMGGRPSRATDAALQAGYANKNKNALSATASRLITNPRVIAAIREEADLRVRAGAILGASVLIQIAEDPTHKQQFKAAVELLNRADLIVASKHEVTVDDKRPDKDELVGRVNDLAERLGIDPNILLSKQSPKLIDVTPEEAGDKVVENTPKPEEVGDKGDQNGISGTLDDGATRKTNDGTTRKTRTGTAEKAINDPVIDVTPKEISKDENISETISEDEGDIEW